MKICWFWVELKLLLVDIAFSARLSGEATRVSQRFGRLTIDFSRCVCEERSADGLRTADRYDDVGMTYYLLLISRYAISKASRCVVVLRTSRDQQMTSLISSTSNPRRVTVHRDNSSLDFHRIQPSFLEIFVALSSPCLALSFATHLRSWISLEVETRSCGTSKLLRKACASVLLLA
ncbi:Laccase [Dorcoceras hygrometricum]|uniref:Laccase n=1 Tax=Dorcoceras hygrometricum TaxID=472368 RepID=A0A2Z7C945_9LAMI|nr:Laccase [Dorcoceras hygrometricum]